MSYLARIPRTTAYLAPGDPRRAAAGRFVYAALLAAFGFEVFALATTQIPGIRVQSPWQDDPYDAVVSFTMQLVPAVAVLLALRITRCRAGEPLPATRVVEVTRAANVVLASILLTAAVDWIAVARGAAPHPPAALVGALALVTLTAATALGLARRGEVAPAREGPDWAADVSDAIVELTRPLGPLGRAARTASPSVAAVLDHPLGPRRHPIAAALLIASAAGAGLSITHAVSEGGLSHPAFLALYAGIETAGALLLLLLVGGYLRLLRAPAD